MKKLILIVVMLVAGTLMAAPTVRHPAIPVEEPEREILIISQSLEMRNRHRECVAAPTTQEVLISFPFLEMRKTETELPEADLFAEAEAMLPEEPKPAEKPEDVLPKAEEPLPAPEPEVWREDVPLRPELQQVLLEACAKNGVDPLIMLGLIETESGFLENAVSSTWDYGLCQLNHLYFDPTMTPEENLQTGVELLGRHLKTYGNISAALTAYHWGHDNGTRSYANVVLDKAAAWGYAA